MTDAGASQFLGYITLILSLLEPWILDVQRDTPTSHPSCFIRIALYTLWTYLGFG